jgi:crotonobetainyl-CoA:carnitine CoA-transferase CaiB-like acyl-CoA transferase
VHDTLGAIIDPTLRDGPRFNHRVPRAKHNADTSIRAGAPKLGEHTASVLTRFLQLDPDHVTALARSGVVSV